LENRGTRLRRAGSGTEGNGQGRRDGGTQGRRLASEARCCGGGPRWVRLAPGVAALTAPGGARFKRRRRCTVID
jgi:hypothetical protein